MMVEDTKMIPSFMDKNAVLVGNFSHTFRSGLY